MTMTMNVPTIVASVAARLGVLHGTTFPTRRDVQPNVGATSVARSEVQDRLDGPDRYPFASVGTIGACLISRSIRLLRRRIGG